MRENEDMLGEGEECKMPKEKVIEKDLCNALVVILLFLVDLICFMYFI